MNPLHSTVDPFSLARTADANATFEEHEDLKTILLAGSARFEIQAVAEVQTKGPVFSIYTACIGSRDSLAPALGFFGGIHRLTCNPAHYPSHYAANARDADVAAWIRIRKTAPVSPVNAWRQLWATARFSCAAQPPRCPTLSLSSAADGLVHPHCSARVAAAWQAVHHQHPWAGHDLPHDDPDWVCQRIVQWLD